MRKVLAWGGAIGIGSARREPIWTRAEGCDGDAGGIAAGGGTGLERKINYLAADRYLSLEMVISKRLALQLAGFCALADAGSISARARMAAVVVNTVLIQVYIEFPHFWS